MKRRELVMNIRDLWKKWKKDVRELSAAMLMVGIFPGVSASMIQPLFPTAYVVWLFLFLIVFFTSIWMVLVPDFYRDTIEDPAYKQTLFFARRKYPRFWFWTTIALNIALFAGILWFWHDGFAMFVLGVSAVRQGWLALIIKKDLPYATAFVKKMRK